MSGVKKEKPRLKYAVELSRHIQGFGLYLTLAILCNLMFKLLPLATSLVTSYMVSSVLLVKNAAGVTGLFALLLLCARPLMTLAAALVALRLVSALLEPVAEDTLIALADKFSQVAGMLLVICVSAAVILTLLLGGTLTAGQSVVR